MKTLKYRNEKLKALSFKIGDESGGSACKSCNNSYCCESMVEIGIGIDEFNAIEHLVTPKHIERAKYQVEYLSKVGGKSSYRCPFLSEEGRCEIYDSRPIVCAAYSVVGDPKDCSLESNPTGGVNIVNPLIIFTEAGNDGYLVDMIKEVIVHDEPTDILNEFKRRYL